MAGHLSIGWEECCERTAHRTPLPLQRQEYIHILTGMSPSSRVAERQRSSRTMRVKNLSLRRDFQPLVAHEAASYWLWHLGG